MRQTLAALLVAGALGLLALPRIQAAPATMPVSEIRPGMVGIGRTVFAGTKVEEFRANILGVVENVIGTQRNLILAKLEGGPLAETGVIAGMSGSPVYVDGRLIGAVSYALGSFSKEPIAGITPIDEMTAETSLGAARPAAARIHLEFPVSQESLTTAFRKALNWNTPFAAHPEDARLVGATRVGGFGTEVAAMMRPIATPLSMSGFQADVADAIGNTFRDQGFIPMAAGPAGSHGEMPYEGPLKPGDAIGVIFVDGDLQLGGTGTVTNVDGDRVYAFGHPMYNLGPTEFPMTRAYVYTVLPSLFSSSKLSTTGEVIGTFTEDRPTAIAGRLGPAPRTVPITLTLESDRVPTHVFHFSVARDELFTPLMALSALQSTLLSYERQYGASTYAVSGTAVLKNHEPITFTNLFSGTGQESPATTAAAYVMAPIASLVSNDYEKVDLDRIDLTFKATEEPQSAALQRVWVDDPRPRAGKSVPVKVLLRTYRGEDLVETVPIDIPANAHGNLSVTVMDGARLNQLDQRDVRGARSITQLIRALNKVRRNDALYVRLLSSDPGAVVNGEVLPSLPPSVLAVVEADRATGGVTALNSATLGEWNLPVGRAVSGQRTIQITVSPN
ncbi:MAG TPA: SpoIVB peptidase S55 domain-containing protein [Vicinamibacterales bacterium]|nr:SpoIVB peptidase S55 domain-containing protein [Vicinamibacterales bacterium]